MVVLKMIKIKASSMVETVVALTLIVFVFGLATTIFVRLTNNNLGNVALKAEKTLENFRLETHNKQAYFDERLNENEFIIKRLIEERTNQGGLIVIKFMAFDDRQNLLCEIRELMMKPSGYEKN